MEWEILLGGAPKATAKLNYKGNDVNNITTCDINAILVHYFDVAKIDGKKVDQIKALQDTIDSDTRELRVVQSFAIIFHTWPGFRDQ